jgi:hypothetical protein
VVGIDCHIGSQITDAAPYLEAMDRVLDLVEAIEAAGIPIHHIDFGGGLGIDYNGDAPPAGRRAVGSVCWRAWTRAASAPRAHDRARPLAGGQRRGVPDRGAVPQARRAEELLHRRRGHERPAAAGHVPGVPPPSCR